MAYKLIVNVNKDSEDLSDEVYEEILKLSYNGIEISPKDARDTSFPLPWDASIKIIHNPDFFILKGGLGPSSQGYPGYAVAKIPLSSVNYFLDLTIYTDRYEDASYIKALLYDHKWYKIEIVGE